VDLPAERLIEELDGVLVLDEQWATYQCGRAASMASRLIDRIHRLYLDDDQPCLSELDA
jgi:hypothetical protein